MRKRAQEKEGEREKKELEMDIVNLSLIVSRRL